MTMEENQDALASMDDAALFDAIASGESLPEIGEGVQEFQLDSAPQPQPEASSAPQAPAAEPSPQPHQQDHRVPLSELLDEREKRRDLARRLAEFERREEEARRSQQAPDVFEDPAAAILHEVRPVIAPVQNVVMGLTREVAEIRYSREEVADAEQAFNEAAFSGRMDPALHHRINNSANPFAAAVEWHRQQKVLSEVGNDIGAFRLREREAALNDPEFLKRALEHARSQAQAAPVVNLSGSSKPATLPSVSRMGAAAPIGRSQADEADDETLWNEVTAPRRK